jgi:hypothetical protein
MKHSLFILIAITFNPIAKVMRVQFKNIMKIGQETYPENYPKQGIL